MPPDSPSRGDRDVVQAVKYRVSEDIIGEELSSGYVLIDTATQAIFELNETAWRIWQLLGQGLSQDEIVSKLLAEYDADEVEVRASVEEAIAEFIDDGLVVAGD